MKRLISAIISAAMVFAAAGCSQKPAAPPVPAAQADDGLGKLEFKFASIFAPGDPMADTIEKFAEIVKEKSGGAIICNTYNSGVLGDERSSYEAMRTGSIEMVANSALADVIFYAPEWAVLSTPYVVRDMDHFHKIWESDFADEVNGYIEQNFGITTLGIMDRGARHLTSNVKVETPADLKGLKLRLSENDVYVKVWSALGATPVVIPLGEVYTSLQTGVAQAQENPFATITSNKFQEVQKYLMLTNHIIEGFKIQVSTSWWNGLTEAQRNFLQECADEAIVYGNQLVAETESKFLEEIKAAGVTVVEPDMEAFRQAAQPIIEELGKTYFKEGLMDRILAIE